MLVIFLLSPPAGDSPIPWLEGGLGGFQYLEEVVVIHHQDEGQSVQGMGFPIQDILPCGRGAESMQHLGYVKYLLQPSLDLDQKGLGIQRRGWEGSICGDLVLLGPHWTETTMSSATWVGICLGLKLSDQYFVMTGLVSQPTRVAGTVMAAVPPQPSKELWVVLGTHITSTQENFRASTPCGCQHETCRFCFPSQKLSIQRPGWRGISSHM